MSGDPSRSGGAFSGGDGERQSNLEGHMTPVFFGSAVNNFGVVGSLQFDVMADRIRTEYDVPVIFEGTELYTARWLECDDPLVLKKMMDATQTAIADDHTGAPVFLARNAWHLDRTMQDFPAVKFLKTREMVGG